MKAVDFYKLARAIQDRFVGSVMSGFPPAPMLAAKGGMPTKLAWLGLSGGCFLLLLIVARLGYGNLDSALSLHSWKALPLYLGLFFGLGFGIVQAYARLVRERALPYTSGVYHFPSCLIDARHDQFKVYETKDLADVAVQGGAVRVSFAGGASFVFPLADPQRAGDIVQELQSARDRAMRAHATEDAAELVAVDPLHNPRFSSPVGPRDAYTMKTPPWGKLGWAVALGVAVVFGPTIWALRNHGSDKKMYAIATQQNDTASYRAYLQRGRKYEDEVGGILLPRAELRDAEAIGTVDALLAYKAAHPDSKIQGEVARSIRAAMLGELEKAKAPGTLAALQAFAKRYPEHGVEPELRAAMHAVYARELEAYKKRAPTKDKAAVAFVERLFAWAEKHGPSVEVRFRRKPPALERADQTVLKSPNFMGVVTYPSRFFDDKHAVPREEALGKMLATQFDTGLSPELLSVKVGAPVPADGDLPAVTEATLFVTHLTEWSGHTYPANKPRGIFVGLNFHFDASFVIPGDDKPYRFKTMVFRHAALYALKDADVIPPPGQAEDKVYSTMADEAFERFAKQLLAGFFKESK